MNLKSVDGNETLHGPTVCLGGAELYVPSCFQHFEERIIKAQGGGGLGIPPPQGAAGSSIDHPSIDYQAAWDAGDMADAEQLLVKAGRVAGTGEIRVDTGREVAGKMEVA